MIPDKPVTGSRSIRFSIHDGPASAASFGTKTQAVTLSDGIFSVQLGSYTAITQDVFGGANRWLEIRVGADPAMTPRQRIVSNAFSYLSAEADTLAYGATVSAVNISTLNVTSGKISLLKSDSGAFLHGMQKSGRIIICHAAGNPAYRTARFI